GRGGSAFRARRREPDLSAADHVYAGGVGRRGGDPDGDRHGQGPDPGGHAIGEDVAAQGSGAAAATWRWPWRSPGAGRGLDPVVSERRGAGATRASGGGRVGSAGEDG